MRRHRSAFPVLLAIAGMLLMAGEAGAASLLDDVRQRAAGTTDARCFERDLAAGPGVDTRKLAVPGPALLRASLDGDESADWDLAVVERTTGRVIAASAARGSDELAEGFVVSDTGTLVRACRRSGTGDAELSVETVPIEPAEGTTTPPQLVRVETPTETAKKRLQGLGLDLTEHGGEDFLTVVSYGPTDLATIASAGLEYEVLIPDLVEASVADRRADSDVTAEERAMARREIPSGRTTYRRLFEFQEEMKALAEDHPDIVRPLTLAHETWEGRPIEGIEITTNPDNVDDGKPVYLQMGAHHAREWPSAEHAMEYALELIEGYEADDPRITPLVESSRTIVVPVVNPDGFNVSREAGQIAGAEGGRHAETEDEFIEQIVGIAYEYWRKNCRVDPELEEGRCLGHEFDDGAAHPGVDLNRNYGGLWGGPGAGTHPLDPTFRGPGPFSEPETRSIQNLISNRQVTLLISNHTFSNLWLRPPGQSVTPDSPDEELMRTIGEQATAENGYSNIRAWELYDTTGSVEDWSYWSTGGLGFTPEIGCTEKEGIECIFGDFHGPYADQVVEEYGGGTDTAPEGGGNREAYLLSHEHALSAETHSVLAGQAPAGARLTVEKTFETQTWKGEHGSFQDHLESSLTVPESGQFEWHVNPSTRPITLLVTGRPSNGDPSPPVPISGEAGPEAQACESFETEDPNCFNDHPFTVPANQAGVIDNAKLTVRIDWATVGSDWDLRIFSDSNNDGSSVGEEEIAQSGQGSTTFEEAALVEPNFPAAGNYVARVVNWSATEPYTGSITFAGPDPPQGPGEPEAWTLSCERDGEVLSSQQVFVARGETANLDLNASCVRATEPPGACATELRGSRKGDRLTGTEAGDRIIGRAGNDRIRGEGGDDCLFGGKGRDRLNGGPGADQLAGGSDNDKIVARDGEADHVRCGTGRDKAIADAQDTLKGCEQRRVRP